MRKQNQQKSLGIGIPGILIGNSTHFHIRKNWGTHVPPNDSLVPPSLCIESIEEPWKSRLPMFCKLLLATTYQASLKMMTDEIRHSIQRLLLIEFFRSPLNKFRNSDFELLHNSNKKFTFSDGDNFQIERRKQ